MTRATVLAALAAALSPFAVAALVATRPRPWLRRGIAVAALARIGRLVGRPAASAGLTARLASAGLAERMRVADLLAAKAGAAAIALLGALPVASVLPGRLGPAALLAAPVAAFLAPDLWLRRLTRGRARRVESEMADVLDLLRVAVEAGMAPTRALGEVGRRHPGVLAAELRAVATRTALGVPHERALDELLARTPGRGVVALALALRRAQRHGAPLGPAVAALAADARFERARRVRERAAKAAPKIQLVIALLLVPAVLLLVAAALASTLLP